MPRTTSAPPRVLRLGLVIGDQLIDERKLARGAVVTIGQSLDCTFAVALESLPRRWVLFDAAGELQLAPGMDAQRDGDRGRVSIGEITILFHWTEARDEPRMALPVELRRSLLGRMDRRLAAFVAGSIVLHAGIATAAWLHDGAEVRTRRAPATAILEPAMVDLIAAMSFEPIQPSDPDAPNVPPAQPHPPGVAKPPTTNHGGGGTRRPSLPELTPAQYLAALRGGGGGPGDLPALPDLPAIDDEPGPGARDDRGPRTRDPVGPAGPGDRDVDGPGDVQRVDKDPVKPPTTKPTPDDPDDLPIDRDWISDVVRMIETRYMNGLERCQKKLLASDPLATSMAVKLSFTVGADGRVGARSAKSEDAGVSSCISDQMKGWDLPAPPTGKDSHVVVKLALQGS